MTEQLIAVDQVERTVLDLALRFGPKVLAAVLILVMGLFVSRWIDRWLRRALNRLDLEPPVRQLLARLTRALIVLLFAIVALQNLGIELLPLIAGLGVAGAAVALAMQGVLSNVAAGLTIIFTKPFRVGEYVSVVTEEGVVESISLFNTTLSHVDKSLIVIPNRKIVGEILHNFGRIRQLDIVVGVAYDTDLNAALATINEIVRGNPRVLAQPAPVIRAALLDSSAVNIDIKPWVAVPDYGPAAGEINQSIVETFRARGIVIPFPQREVRVIGQGVQLMGPKAAVKGLVELQPDTR